jgi:hypothetical protein
MRQDDLYFQSVVYRDVGTYGLPRKRGVPPAGRCSGDNDSTCPGGMIISIILLGIFA